MQFEERRVSGDGDASFRLGARNGSPAFAVATAGRLALRYKGGEMDVGGTFAGFGGEIADGGDDARRVEMPFDEEAIGGHAAVERAGGDAIEIGDVAAADGAETIDVKMSVFCFERIEGPLDETNAAAECVFALGEFELTANAAVAMRRQDGSHMRVKIGSKIVQTDEGFGEADHGVAIEGAENLAAGLISDNEGDVGFGVEFAVGPDLAGDGNAAMEFVESVERADGDVWSHRRTVSHKLSGLREKSGARGD